jgi:hypothetical protein
MDKEILLDISKKINCEYEVGIWSEINHFLEQNENVKEFTVNYLENHFRVEVNLKDFNLNSTKKLFSSLLMFLEYNSAFYVRDEKDGCIEYYLLSSMKSNKGFMSHIIIK